jgi:hypothetical protein
MSASIQPTVRTGHRVQFRKTRLPTLERDPNQGRDSTAVSGKYLFSSCKQPIQVIQDMELKQQIDTGQSGLTDIPQTSGVNSVSCSHFG